MITLSDLIQSYIRHLQVGFVAVCTLLVIIGGSVFLLRSLLPPLSRNCVGFFHPYCHAGGGGERVLWIAVRATLSSLPSSSVSRVVIYTSDLGTSKADFLAKARERFGVVIDEERISFVYLSHVWLIKEATYPVCTLLGQSLGSLVLFWSGLRQVRPRIMIDTMGLPFILPALLVLSPETKSSAYVHYPTLTPDMIGRVRRRIQSHTHQGALASSLPLTYAKLAYYQAFLAAYTLALRCADVVMANGSWTANHLRGLGLEGVIKLYPPCDTVTLAKLPLNDRKLGSIVSLAQFRPEKDHDVQIRAIHHLLQKKLARSEEISLTLMGSSRNQEDERRVESLKKLASSLGISDNVHFIVNAPYEDIVTQLGDASIGLSTMIDEHFGIGVVEFMAAGLIVVAHASGGPLLDIAVPLDGQVTGFHAKSIEEFSERLEHVLNLSVQEGDKIRIAARTSSQRFNEETFEKDWRSAWETLMLETQN